MNYIWWQTTWGKEGSLVCFHITTHTTSTGTSIQQTIHWHSYITFDTSVPSSSVPPYPISICCYLTPPHEIPSSLSRWVSCEKHELWDEDAREHQYFSDMWAHTNSRHGLMCVLYCLPNFIESTPRTHSLQRVLSIYAQAAAITQGDLPVDCYKSTAVC